MKEKEKVHLLKVHRVACGLTMKELGEIMNVPTSQIQRIEERIASPRINLVYSLCRYFEKESPKSVRPIRMEDFLF